MRRQRFQWEFCHWLWSVKPVRISSVGSKSGQIIVPVVHSEHELQSRADYLFPQTSHLWNIFSPCVSSYWTDALGSQWGAFAAIRTDTRGSSDNVLTLKEWTDRVSSIQVSLGHWERGGLLGIQRLLPLLRAPLPTQSPFGYPTGVLSVLWRHSG